MAVQGHKHITPGSESEFMGINQFINTIQDFVRPSLFLVEMNGYGFASPTAGGMAGAPSGGINEDGATTKSGTINNFKFYCNASTIPSSEVGSISANFMGREIKVAGTRTFGDWSVTVYNDGAYTIRDFFEKWSSKINSHEGNLGYNRILDYYGRADVYQLDQTGAILSTYRMDGVFPTSIGEISLNWSSGNEVSTFTVNFAIGNFWTSQASREVDGTDNKNKLLGTGSVKGTRESGWAGVGA